MKNAKLDNFHDSASKPYTGLVISSCYVDNTQSGKHHHRDGIFFHERTIARFFANRFDNDSDPNKNRRYTTVSVVKDGIQHSREWRGYYGKKTISRLANIFIEEIFGVVD
jgi:hypothetical protein